MAQSTSLYPHPTSGATLQSTLYNPASPIGGANRVGISSYVISPRPYASPIVDFGLPLGRLPDDVLAQSAAVARMRAHREMHSLLVTNAVSPSPHAPPHHQRIGAPRLELLRAAMGIPDLDHDAVGGRLTAAAAPSPVAASSSGRPAAQLDATLSLTRDPRGLLFVDSILEADVLCGRGGLSNHHPGNKRFRRVVSEMKRTYRSTETKNNKTSLSRAIVDHVCNYGGRFIKKDEKTGRYHVLTKADARKKTSQALRETKELKWTV